MSLIQDALKRKREEESLQPPKPSPVVPPAPEPAAPPPPPPENAGKSSSNRILFVLLAVIALLLIGFGLSKLRQTPSQTAAVEPKPVPVPEQIVEIAEPVEEPEPPPPPPPAEPEDKWPELQITGFVSGGGRQMVVINGKMLSVGKRVSGARVIEISEDEIVLEFKGEQRTLYVDE